MGDQNKEEFNQPESSTLFIYWKLPFISANFLFFFLSKKQICICINRPGCLHFCLLFFQQFSIKISWKKHVSIFETASNNTAQIDPTFFWKYSAKPMFRHSPQCYHCLFPKVGKWWGLCPSRDVVGWFNIIGLSKYDSLYDTCSL